MSLVDDVGSELVRSVWATLVNGTLVVGATWILSATLFRRSPAWLQAALWTLALLKFVVPCGPSLDYSVSRACRSLPSRAGSSAGWPVGPAPSG